MSGEQFPSRDPGVFVRPGAASIRPAALLDAIYELAVGTAVGITAEGAQLLVDQGLADHTSGTDPHGVYLTLAEGDARYATVAGGAFTNPYPSDMVFQADTASLTFTQGGRAVLDTAHTAAADPHPQYQTAAEVQAAVDAAVAALKAEPDPFPVYLQQSEGDGRYLLLTGGTLSGALRLPNLGQVVWRNGAGTLDLPLTVNAGDQLTYDGVVVVTQTALDALTTRVAVLEGQMSAGASGHVHGMGTWREVGKPIIPVTQVAEVAQPAAARR